MTKRPIHIKPVPPQPFSAAAELGVQFNRLGQAWRRELDNELQAYGLTDATWRPLFFLGRLGDGIRQKDLAQALGIEGPSLVRLLDNLEAQDLVQRRDSPTDRRSKALYMTQTGRAISAQVREVADRIAAELLANVSENEFAVSRHMLEKIDEALRARSGKKRSHKDD